MAGRKEQTEIGRSSIRPVTSANSAAPTPTATAERESPSPEMQPVLESGVLVYPNGEKYDGQYLTLRGKSIARSGHGKYIYNDGTVFEGDWANDKLKGHATVHFGDGSFYKGEMRDLKFHGQGTYTFPNGTSVSGKFKKSRLQGDISYTDEKGECWLGSAAENKAMGMQLRL